MQFRIQEPRNALALAAAFLLLSSQSFAEEPAEGFRWLPDLGWRAGDHHVELHTTSRYRFEAWDARALETDTIHALRTRVSARHSWKNAVVVFGQRQHVKLWDLSASGSGAAGLYRANTSDGDEYEAESLDLRQLWLEFASPWHAQCRRNRSLQEKGMGIGRAS